MRRYERDDINLVFNTIILSDKDPISNKKLSLKTGLNRDRIRIICNQLEHDQNKITIIENGKRRSYIANPTIRERILRDQPKLDGYLLDFFLAVVLMYLGKIYHTIKKNFICPIKNKLVYIPMKFCFIVFP